VFPLRYFGYRDWLLLAVMMALVVIWFAIPTTASLSICGEGAAMSSSLPERRTGLILAVEFPSPCDGNESRIRDSVLGGLVQVRTPGPFEGMQSLPRPHCVDIVALSYICSSWENPLCLLGGAKRCWPAQLHLLVVYCPKQG